MYILTVSYYGVMNNTEIPFTQFEKWIVLCLSDTFSKKHIPMLTSLLYRQWYQAAWTFGWHYYKWRLGTVGIWLYCMVSRASSECGVMGNAWLANQTNDTRYSPLKLLSFLDKWTDTDLEFVLWRSGATESDAANPRAICYHTIWNADSQKGETFKY
jgi:hypothetical protein